MIWKEWLHGAGSSEENNHKRSLSFLVKRSKADISIVQDLSMCEEINALGGETHSCSDMSYRGLEPSVKNVHRDCFDSILTMLFVVHHQLLRALDPVCSTGGFLSVFPNELDLEAAHPTTPHLSRSPAEAEQRLQHLQAAPAPRSQTSRTHHPVSLCVRLSVNPLILAATPRATLHYK